MNCPLCRYELVEETMTISGRPSYHCSACSNYKKYVGGGWSAGCYYEEHIDLFPYKIENHYFEHKDPYSVIKMYKEIRPTAIIGASVMGNYPNPGYVRIAVIPLLHIDSKEKLQERLKLLLLLS